MNLRATSGTVHFAARWSADLTDYTVKHILQGLDGNYNDAVPEDTETWS